MTQPPQPFLEPPPKLPPRPWYEREPAPLGKDEWDAYDEMMRPGQKPGRRTKLFL